MRFVLVGRAGKGRVLWGAPWEEAGRPALKTRMALNVVVNMNIILVMNMIGSQLKTMMRMVMSMIVGVVRVVAAVIDW